MPPEPYVMAHPANRLTESDKQEITTWARAEGKRIRTESAKRKGQKTRELGKRKKISGRRSDDLGGRGDHFVPARNRSRRWEQWRPRKRKAALREAMHRMPLA